MKFVLIASSILLTQLAFAVENINHLGSQIPLTTDEMKTFEIGLLGNTRYITGGILGTLPGFGLGHTIQGRWKDRGWIFTVGELASLSVFYYSGLSCLGEGVSNSISRGTNDGSSGSCYLANVAFAGFIGFKIWEIVDLWYGGYQHQQRYDLLKKKMNLTDNKISYNVLPIVSSNSLGLGLNIRF